MIIALLTIAASFLLATLIRRFGSHTLLNGYMSEEKADEVFPMSKEKADKVIPPSGTPKKK